MTSTLAAEGWPPAPTDPDRAFYDAARAMPEVDPKISGTDKRYSNIGIEYLGPDRDRYEAKYGPGSADRDLPLVAEGNNRAVGADTSGSFDKNGPVLPFEDYKAKVEAYQLYRRAKAALPAPPPKDDEAYAAWKQLYADEVRRELRRGSGPTPKTAAQTYADYLGVRSLGAIPKDPPEPLLLDRLDPEGPTILFGPGNIGKGVYTSYLVFKLVDAGHHVLILDYENHPTEWARRIYGFSGHYADDRVKVVTPLSAEWGGPRGPLWDQAEYIKAVCDELGITYLVIDSIIPASMGIDASTGNTQAPSQYDAALQYIGLPSLSLGHVTRSGDNRYPFGSVMWHNLARVTWSMEEAPDGDSKRLKNRKHNNYEKQPDQIVTVTWMDGLPRDVQERPHAVVLTDLLLEDLREGDKTVAEITASLNAEIDEDAKPYKADSIKKALQRGLTRTPRLFAKRGDRWGLPGSDA